MKKHDFSNCSVRGIYHSGVELGKKIQEFRHAVDSAYYRLAAVLYGKCYEQQANAPTPFLDNIDEIEGIRLDMLIKRLGQAVKDSNQELADLFCLAIDDVKEKSPDSYSAREKEIKEIYGKR
jgi:hypothetical protein